MNEEEKGVVLVPKEEFRQRKRSGEGNGLPGFLSSLCLPLLGDEAGRSAKYGQRKCGPMWAERLESGKTEGKSLPADSSSTCHLY